MPPAVKVSDISAFYKANTRAENDKSNKVREGVLTIINDITHPFFNDNEFGSKWVKLRFEFIKWLKANIRPDFTEFALNHKGGLRNRIDFILTLTISDGTSQTEKLEFKFNSVPQFANEFDKQIWTDKTLAEFWWDSGYLDKIIALYPQPLKFPKPTRDIYLKRCHILMTSKSPDSFFKQFYDFDHNKENFQAQYDAKSKLSEEGIRDFLSTHGNTFDVPKLYSKLQKSQLNKKYFIWKPLSEIFEFDQITDSELAPSAIKTVTKNSVVLTAGPSELHCLLRWKNSLGIACPAWQIKLIRPT